METIPKPTETAAADEPLAYSVQEAAELLGLHYFTVCRLIQRKKLKMRWSPCGKPLVPRTEVLRLLKSE